ncbi:hypothetical protein EI77_01075 [Prosthecobacter fusiformis]|uniref:Uncharacterized protein n=1 Tax=Prosthecobacter fusiformis TaxID=48464 RepID=A0A4R7SSL0_9BACT|nr:hypothetical protein EI77_01075 [Prosthecobacter fusiformis]
MNFDGDEFPHGAPNGGKDGENGDFMGSDGGRLIADIYGYLTLCRMTAKRVHD